MSVERKIYINGQNTVSLVKKKNFEEKAAYQYRKSYQLTKRHVSREKLYISEQRDMLVGKNITFVEKKRHISFGKHN